MRIRKASLLALCAALLRSVAADGASCMLTNSTLSFGGYNPTSLTPNTANATITVTCMATISLNTAVPYMLLLSAGGSGSVTNRAMSGTASLPYNIYTSSTYTTVWDNTTGVSGSVTIVGALGLPILTSGSAMQIAYGRILAQQPVPAGSYLDALTMTVSF